MSCSDDSGYQMDVEDSFTSSEEESSDEDDSSSTSSEASDENLVPDPFASTNNWPWSNTGIPRPAFPFGEPAGVQVDVNAGDVVGIFESFFDDFIIDLIVQETNRYANQYISNNSENLRPNSRVKKWQETNNDEIKTLLGILILQGVTQKPEYKLYFSRRESIETPFFPRIMSEKRFHLLLKFIHFVDNTTITHVTKNRKLAKISPIVDYLRAKFMSCYVPDKNIAIDESLIGWKGRLGWKQYIPTKRKRFGIKVYALCESNTGYMYNFFIYTGSDTDYGDKYSAEPITNKIVLSLVDPLLGKGYKLFLDNFYTSVDLVDKLVKNRTDCIGTMRINRKGLPKEMKGMLQKGEIVAMYRKKIMVLKWKDKKDVLMISTIHDAATKTVNTRKGEIVKPECILEYNNQMGGVDLSDNYLHFYNTSRCRVKKFYMKIFSHLLSVTTLNCYQMFKKMGGRQKRLYFLLQLGENLISKYAHPINVQKRRSKTPMSARFVERHFPALIPPTTKEKPTKRCVVCAEQGKKRKESRYCCRECYTGLCPAPCFGIYHTK